MAINRVSIASQNIEENYDTTIEVYSTRPDTDEVLDDDNLLPPGKIIGYFNGASGFVELYVVSGDGRRFFRV